MMGVEETNSSFHGYLGNIYKYIKLRQPPAWMKEDASYSDIFERVCDIYAPLPVSASTRREEQPVQEEEDPEEEPTYQRKKLRYPQNCCHEERSPVGQRHRGAADCGHQTSQRRGGREKESCGAGQGTRGYHGETAAGEGGREPQDYGKDGRGTAGLLQRSLAGPILPVPAAAAPAIYPPKKNHLPPSKASTTTSATSVAPNIYRPGKVKNEIRID